MKFPNTKDIFLLTRRILFLFLVVLFVISCKPAKFKPKATNGELVLTHWNFKSDGIYALNGEWNFYWKKLLIPTDFEKNKQLEKTGNFNIPGLWNSKSFNGEKLGSNGYATFRLKIILNNSNKIQLALRLGRIETAYKLFVNNNLIGESGIVGASRNEMKPKWKTDYYLLPQNTDTLYITMQVSNFNHRKGGFNTPILIGEFKEIEYSGNKLVWFDIFLFGVLLIMSIYHFGLYLLRRKEVSPLYFGLACLLTAIFMTVNGEFLLTKIWPGFNWEILVKINFISNCFRISFFALFIGALFKDDFSPKYLKYIFYWAVVMSLFVLVTPARIFSHSLLIIILTAVTVFIYIIYNLIKIAFRRKEGAGYSLIGTAVLLITVLNDSLFDYSVIQTFYMVPFGLFIFIFFQSFMLSVRFSRSFSAVEELSERLLILDKIKNDLLTISSYDIGRTLKIFVDNFLAQRGILFLSHFDRLYYEAEAFFDREDSKFYEDLTVEGAFSRNLQFPMHLIKTSINLKKSILLENGSSDDTSGDPYLAKNNIKSLICIPIFENEHLKAVIYLEHSLTQKVFNREKMIVLELLRSQITAIIDNALIYSELENLNRHLEETVQVRTAEVYQQKEEIEAQRDEIEAKNKTLNVAYDEIERKNRDITDSIKYAKRIQESILPTADFVKDLFHESFIFFQPKDILSGDFYWFENVYSSEVYGQAKSEKILAAAVDCTGHGVPGALMSIIANNLLNFAVHELKQTKPGEILNCLQQGLRIKLKSPDKRNHSTDGMDISLISFEPTTKKLIFAGAKNPIYIVRSNELIVIEADKYSIGDIVHLQNGNDIPYNNQFVQIQSGDVIYMFTDGFSDQFGGPKSRKYTKGRFQAFLQSIANDDIQNQKILLEKHINEWKGIHAQIDDMLVIGLKID